MPFSLVQVRRVTPKPLSHPGAFNDMTYLLNDNEKIRLAIYDDDWFAKFGQRAGENPDAVFHLGDNPLMRRVWSASGRMPSFRRSMGILWHPFSGTVISGKERLAMMGWPCYYPLALAAGTHMITVHNVAHARQMVGNSYHIAVVGVGLLVCLACTRPAKH
jgi:hypothetical protein